MAKLWAYQTDRVVELPMSSWIIMLPLTALMQSEGEREINSHSSPPLSHRKPTIMDATVDRTMRIQFRRVREGSGMGRDGQREREGEHARVGQRLK